MQLELSYKKAPKNKREIIEKKQIIKQIIQSERKKMV